MKTIAALTTLFLPGTFLSSVFSMSNVMLNDVKWWLYVALAVPLTLVVVGSWGVWHMRGWANRPWRRKGVNQFPMQNVV